ncbi:enoyl-CoA hydratase [Sulfitobacter sp. M57]|uniref:oxepin-CoA hydrolase, alternative type n=1 Tax=unclassified Sulfitobacter TaxID=196795 RepID=UPI0023E109F5|nr:MULTISPECIES: enoyl-CoA hydratase family protein [unclassified Sulfitobacter]MDF3415926.1 enoyl-CoA hydratase [Sulfitobacter sp. KE5]MDF3423406.1 enoyl-CoA hydratase [Sulfitobacter sp. KE43]MDF3434472.1 enoyl-CoA hydratase [Sulfitobacter sp. KE42]MDF3460112.1 enoyl-CoA hydratase [Sulfitobacter sp. S74]MDF3464010.1 enoyl-CoA hydratase [Sulfitobacter sp. Ks18]
MSARIEDAGDRLIIWNGNAAKRGALSPELYDCIQTAVKQAQEPRIRAVILTSEGEFFCAGGNLNVLIERRQISEAERRVKVDELHDVLRSIRACPVPVIAAVEGGAAGAGLSIALACDLIVAAKDAKFTAAYVKAGLVPDGGLTSAMARLLPRPLAMEMCLMGRPVMATRFAELGAVNRLVTKGKAMEEAMALVDHLAAGPREAQGVIRGLVSQAYEATEGEQLDAERDAMAAAAGRDEAAEGIAAFLEKRPAVY